MKAIIIVMILNLCVDKIKKINSPNNINMIPAEENALRIRIQKLEKENAQMREISTRKGFYNQYFNELSIAKTNKEAFDIVNERYYTLFGKYRYSDYASFKRMTHYYHNKK